MSHRFPLSVTWTGDTLASTYGRDALLQSPGKPAIPASSAPQYAGDPARWNPEDLLGSALATCHMLTFLALCAKAKVQVKAYEDHAEAELDTVDKVTRITRVHLRPTIRVAPGTSQAKVVDLFEKAHKYCFIANSVTCEAVMAPRVVEA